MMVSQGGEVVGVRGGWWKRGGGGGRGMCDRWISLFHVQNCLIWPSLKRVGFKTTFYLQCH